ncbi:MAG: N-acetylglucosamine-6-phosphate deacetylase [Nocardioidaceae bacterium]|nr:N-acetylglucosamine-6-phosphate deacetylase [Nocardioidaceae bacterium]
MTTTAGSPVTLLAETLLTPSQQLCPGWVTVSGPAVVAVGSGLPPRAGELVDLGGRVLAPGFVDLHVHGGAGAQVNGATARDVADSVRRMAAHHARHGTTALLATTVSDTPARLLETLRGIGLCLAGPPAGGARVLGAHLEGPWLAPAMAGAQDLRFLRLPDLEELTTLLDGHRDVVRMVTIAPELPGALDVVAALVEARVVASIGHTEADLATTRAAVAVGARHVTHLFNRMPGLHHRRPGPVGLALTDERLTVELVPDGIHVDPLVIALVMRAAAGRVVAVTDAVAASGQPGGTQRIGELEVEVAEGRVVLAAAPETLAGSVVTMDHAVANLVAAGVSMTDAVSAATETPARVIGEGARGRIEVGSSADLVVLEPSLRCSATVVAGRAVFDPTRLLAGRLG